MKVGGTLDDTQLIEGLVFPENRVNFHLLILILLLCLSYFIFNPSLAFTFRKWANSYSECQNWLIQFCISAPKTEMDNSVVVSDYASMDRIIKQEPHYILLMVKKIADSRCKVLLNQKSILCDAVN
jgi:T-complex protein 1 subunit delta